MFVLSSAGRNLATGLSPVQENLEDIEYKQDSETYSTEGGGGEEGVGGGEGGGGEERREEKKKKKKKKKL